jgi:Endonuclease-reverse transcriptase
MAEVHLLFVNMRRHNAPTHTLLNMNSDADVILVQEPWFDRIGMARSDVNPDRVDVLGGVANPKWDCIYPKTASGERCKVMAYWHISSSFFNVTNRLDLASNHHFLTLDVHLGSSSFHIVNIYHDTDHPSSLRNTLNLELDPRIPTVVGGDFNTHAHAWSPPGIRQSRWALDFEEWALSQTLSLASPLGIATRRGEGNQQDTTIDLVWTNAVATLDETFRDLVVDFAVSIGSDHAGLRFTYHHFLASAIELSPRRTAYVINDEDKEAWLKCFMEGSRYVPSPLSSPDLIDQVVDLLTQDIEQTSRLVFEKRKPSSPKAAVW